MAKIIESFWFRGVSTIGIVVTENEVGIRKTYMGLGFGDNQKEDEQRIASDGVPVEIWYIEKLLCSMKGLPC